MTPEQRELLSRIESFDIDGGESALPFAARLARENGWSRRYADRVIREYRRFVFLAMTGTEPVCPSEDVDAAWHLHLTYTRSYWKRFCGEALGRPLHHEPTRGGPDEARKHLRMYAGTLARYREAFGEEPPTDIWPGASARFGEDLAHRAVNTARNWVIPKRPVKRIAQATAAFVLLSVFLPGCAGGKWNPFNLVGTDFFYFLIPLMIASVFVGRVLRSPFRGPDPQDGDDEVEVDWQEAAYLAGGYPRLTTAAIAELVHNGSAIVSAGGRQLERGPTLPEKGLSEVEMAVYMSLPFGNTPAELRSVQTAVESSFEPQARKLESEGFTLDPSRQVGMALTALVPIFLAILCFAVPRAMMGYANGKPILYLLITTILGGIFCGIASAAGSYRLSRRGENLLTILRSRNAGLNSATFESVPNAALAVALFGTTALVGTSIAYFQTWYPRQTDGGGGCGSGCGSGDGGGGGGGCGGGGCGGCGGS